MSDLFWLSDAQMARLERFFPKSHGKPRVDDRRWKRWSDKGIFAQMLVGLAAEHGEEKTVMIDATYLKAHRTATSMAAKKGGRSPDRSNERRDEHEAACYLRQPGSTD